MICRKCGSEKISIQAVSEIRRKHHSALYWILIGWWLKPILWIFLTLPMLIIAIFRPKKYRSTTKTEAVCQNCGYHWKV